MQIKMDIFLFFKVTLSIILQYSLIYESYDSNISSLYYYETNKINMSMKEYEISNFISLSFFFIVNENLYYRTCMS